MSDIVVYGFAPSTFVRTARLALEEKGVDYELETVEFGSDSLLKLHPFGKIPAFRHGAVRLFETSAITRYVDETFDGPTLQPSDAFARARMNQWISAYNDYYVSLLGRVLIMERIVAPMQGRETDQARIDEALPEIEVRLGVLEGELGDGRPYIVGEELTLADLFFAPPIAYLRMTPESERLLANRPAIGRWFDTVSARPSFAATQPSLPDADAA